jgi:hypothetical protein
VPARVELALEVFDGLEHEEIGALVKVVSRHGTDPGEDPVGKLESGHVVQATTADA